MSGTTRGDVKPAPAMTAAAAPLGRRRVIAGVTGAALAGGAITWPAGRGRDPAAVAVPAPDGALLWTAETERAVGGFFGPVAAGRLLLIERPFAARGRNRRTALSCLDTATGRRSWSIPLGPSGADVKTVVVSGSVVLVRTRAVLYALDLHTGRLLWRRIRNTTGSRATTVTVGAGLVHESGQEDSAATTPEGPVLYAYEMAGGKPRWTAHVQPRAVTADAPIHAAGLLVGTATGSSGSAAWRTFAYALDARTGRQRWWQPFDERDHALESTLVHADGTVYVSSQGGVLHALDAATGTVRWRARPGVPGDSESGMPVVAGTAVYLCGGDGAVRSFDVREGRQRWAFTTGGRPRSVHLVTGPARQATGDHLVYVRVGRTGVDATMYALGSEDGRPRWERRADTSRSGPILGGGLLYVSDGDAVSACDPASGVVRHRLDLRALGLGGNTELATDGARVYALSKSGVLAFGPGR
ncbi:hypothetical protein GCM10010191_05470 [Actinomadura vinacea]|uniref:Pyrrolo-quinoline quinone repeat domain-containing protein n=1 Tax=Actinomadura vinacea TaxID=115336 RepID=A0ABP5VI52_9ACTN